MVAFGWPVVPEVKASMQVSFGGGVHVGEAARLVRHARFQTVRCLVAETQQVLQRCALLLRRLQFAEQRPVAQCVRDLRLGDHLRQFLGAQQRHGRHRDAAGLHHREPARHQHWLVGRAQQHAVAGHEAHVVHQHMGDAVGVLLQLGVGPGQACRRAQAGPVATAFGDMAVQQFARAVQPRRELQLGQLEQELGPLLARWQAFMGKGVDVGAGVHGVVLV